MCRFKKANHRLIIGYYLPGMPNPYYICERKKSNMDAIWYLIGDFFSLMFKVVPFFGLWFNKALIVIGFVAFILWLRYMSQHKTVEKFD